ncbi:MAG: VTT domain-containing protein [Thermoproteota archaeon]|nr:TVP38/TMEM64 family protein [Candidatus Brockarchaeota archaeon]
MASIIVVSILIILNVYPRMFFHLLTQLKEAVLKGGLWGFFFVMIVQSIVSIIPAEAVLVLGGSAFGFTVSSIIGTVGLMAGALINYGIGLSFGRPIVEKIVGGPELEKVEKFFNKHGSKVIFAARFIPWVSFDVISYFSGITGVSILSFTVATLLGTIPRALFYSYFGEKIGLDIERGETSILNYLLLATLLVIVLLTILSEKKASQARSEEA